MNTLPIQRESYKGISFTGEVKHLGLAGNFWHISITDSDGCLLGDVFEESYLQAIQEAKLIVDKKGALLYENGK